MIRPPPRSTLFPYTTPFRSLGIVQLEVEVDPALGEFPVEAQVEGGRLVLVGERSEEHTSELQSLRHLVCRLLLEKKKKNHETHSIMYQNKVKACMKVNTNKS